MALLNPGIALLATERQHSAKFFDQSSNKLRSIYSKYRDFLILQDMAILSVNEEIHSSISSVSGN